MTAAKDNSLPDHKGPGSDDPYEIDLSPYVKRLRLRWRMIAGGCILGALIGAGISRLLPPKYTSEASFIPQASQSGGSGTLAGVAAQLGLSLPTTQTTSSPAFYADLVQSRGILDTLALTRLKDVRDDSSTQVRLLDKYGGHGTPAQRLETAVNTMRKRISATVVVKTGMVGITATTDSPILSESIVQSILSLISDFNLRTRQSQANSERTFVEAQMETAAGDLHAAEDRLRVFMATNQQYRTSSEAALTHERLERDVTLKQELYTALAEALQRARIEEVRNTPVISVVDPPSIPARPRHGTVLLVLEGTLLALIATTAYAVLRN